MKRLINAIMLCSVATLMATVSVNSIAEPSPKRLGITTAEMMVQAPVHWVSIEQIEKSLEGVPPMNVGFDVDDTVLFSAPGFYRGEQLYSATYRRNPEFWQQMNNGWDQFSIPKQVGRDLIAMHLKRGDNLYFVTARTRTPTESVTALLQKTFDIPRDKMHPTIFSGTNHSENTKTPWLKRLRITLYYGDADSDIQAATSANARAIRVMRASNSTYLPLPANGRFGEEVIINSER